MKQPFSIFPWLFTLICIILAILVVYYYFNIGKEPFVRDTSSLKNDINMRIFVINLDKDHQRFQHLSNSFSKSDLSTKYTLNRFPAILGRKINESEWLTPKSIQELNAIEMNGYRTHHYQLTRGGIGCFLSHYTLAKQLLNEPTQIDRYFILEDDIELYPNCLDLIKKLLLFVPDNWDMIPFHSHRNIGPSLNHFFKKFRGFWGMGAYMINRNGARKFVNEVDKMRIDGQVDAYLSRMVQQDKIHIYGSKIHPVKNVSKDTNIQVELRSVPGIDPYNYGGYKV